MWNSKRLPVASGKCLKIQDDSNISDEMLMNWSHGSMKNFKWPRMKVTKIPPIELESWIHEKLQVASDESYKDPTNLQAKIQKHQAFEAEVAAHSNAIVVLDNTGMEMINQGHFQQSGIRARLDELHQLWELLLKKLAEKGLKSEKGLKLQQALVLVQFFRQCDEVMFWIKDKEAFVATEEFGQDLEHVEVLQRKFEEFQKDMASQEYRISEVCDAAEKLINDSHPEIDQINDRKNEVSTRCLVQIKKFGFN